VIPGGVPAHELFDRVAYADKIGARSIYILGGAPTEHPAFFELLPRAKAAVDRVAMLSPVYPFAEEGLAARAAAGGLDAVTCEIHAMDEASHARVFGPGRWAAFRSGLDAIRDAGLERSAHVVVSPETASGHQALLARLEEEGLRVDDITVIDRDERRE
jgi:MoaA/NifB/PqqE/SkfB family radical SAM enzyme